MTKLHLFTTRAPLVAILAAVITIVACSKHQAPVYYDKDGNIIPFSVYKMGQKCLSPNRFNPNADMATTVATLSRTGRHAMTTILTNDSKADISLIAKYPAEEIINDSIISTSNNIVKVDFMCETLQAKVTVPGPSGAPVSVVGDITKIEKNSITVVTADAQAKTEGKMSVSITKQMADASEQKADYTVDKKNDELGKRTLTISISTTSATGEARSIGFTQITSDLIIDPIDIDPVLAQIYSAALSGTRVVDVQKNVTAKSAAAQISSAGKMDIATLIKARDIIANQLIVDKVNAASAQTEAAKKAEVAKAAPAVQAPGAVDTTVKAVPVPTTPVDPKKKDGLTVIDAKPADVKPADVKTADSKPAAKQTELEEIVVTASRHQSKPVETAKPAEAPPATAAAATVKK